MGINDRLSRISANERVFDEAAPPYQEALEKSGFTHKLKFQQPNLAKPKKICRKKTSDLVQPPLFPKCKNQHWKGVD